MDAKIVVAVVPSFPHCLVPNILQCRPPCRLNVLTTRSPNFAFVELCARHNLKGLPKFPEPEVAQERVASFLHRWGHQSLSKSRLLLNTLSATIQVASLSSLELTVCYRVVFAKYTLLSSYSLSAQQTKYRMELALDFVNNNDHSKRAKFPRP